jgi:hypothetical protein
MVNDVVWKWVGIGWVEWIWGDDGMNHKGWKDKSGWVFLRIAICCDVDQWVKN